MYKRIVSVVLMLVLVLGVTVAVFAAASITDATREAVAKAAEAVESAEQIYQKLKSAVMEELTAFDSEEEDEDEFDIDEAMALQKEMDGYAIQLSGLLSGLDGLPDNPDTSDGMTVLATREYLSMLRNMVNDLSELIGYSAELNLAMEAMIGTFGDDDIFEDYEEYSEILWVGCEDTRESLSKIKPPSYLEITHRDLIQRVTEFRDFAEDFYLASVLGDPLRIYSCVYRLNRISRMFGICGDNLNADLELQLHQAERRLNGPVEVLRGELTSNIAALKKALGE